MGESGVHTKGNLEDAKAGHSGENRCPVGTRIAAVSSAIAVFILFFGNLLIGPGFWLSPLRYLVFLIPGLLSFWAGYLLLKGQVKLPLFMYILPAVVAVGAVHSEPYGWPALIRILILLATSYSIGMILFNYNAIQLFMKIFVSAMAVVNVAFVVIYFFRFEIASSSYLFQYARYVSVVNPFREYYLHVNTLSFLNLICCMFSFGLLSKARGLERLLYLILSCFFSAFAIASLSRTVWLQLLIAVIITLIVSRKYFFGFAISLALGSLLWFAGGYVAESLSPGQIDLNSEYWRARILNSTDIAPVETGISQSQLKNDAEGVDVESDQPFATGGSADQESRLNESSSERMHQMVWLLSIWKSSPITIVGGIGLGDVVFELGERFGDLFRVQSSVERGDQSLRYIQPHNIPLWFLAGTGLLGFACVAYYYLRIGYKVVVKAICNRDVITMSLYILSLLLINLFFGLANPAYVLSMAIVTHSLCEGRNPALERN
jgi:hypothetical protein